MSLAQEVDYTFDTITQSVPGVVPAGSMVEWPVKAPAPAGWLKCDGSAVSRTSFAALFAVIGITWGPGDGVNTFNVPDYRAAYSRGASVDGDIATSIGSDTVTLTANQLAIHHHDSISTPAVNYTGGGLNDQINHSGGVGGTPAITGDAGAGAAHENRPASKHAYKIIKT